ncbi:hypothetical protein AB4Y88_04825 [Paenarthrobacter sp. RAF9]
MAPEDSSEKYSPEKGATAQAVNSYSALLTCRGRTSSGLLRCPVAEQFRPH